MDKIFLSGQMEKIYTTYEKQVSIGISILTYRLLATYRLLFAIHHIRFKSEFCWQFEILTNMYIFHINKLI